MEHQTQQLMELGSDEFDPMAYRPEERTPNQIALHQIISKYRKYTNGRKVIIKKIKRFTQQIDHDIEQLKPEIEERIEQIYADVPQVSQVPQAAESFFTDE